VDVEKISSFHRRSRNMNLARKISHKLRPSDMETISEVIYWAVLLYTPIYWFIGLIVLGGCFIAGTIWSTLAFSWNWPTGSYRRPSIQTDKQGRTRFSPLNRSIRRSCTCRPVDPVLLGWHARFRPQTARPSGRGSGYAWLLYCLLYDRMAQRPAELENLIFELLGVLEVESGLEPSKGGLASDYLFNFLQDFQAILDHELYSPLGEIIHFLSADPEEGLEVELVETLHPRLFSREELDSVSLLLI
jgi:hypothetical protein